MRGPDAEYGQLRNNFLGIALHERNPSALPLISVAILCAVAERLGITIEPCGVPFHVVAMVRPHEGEDLDGLPQAKDTPVQLMYLDPYDHDDEVPIEDLIERFRDIGATSSTYMSLVQATNPSEMVLRASRNIMHSIAAIQRRDFADDLGPGTPRLNAHVIYPDVEKALYSALWVSVLVGMLHSGNLSDGLDRVDVQDFRARQQLLLNSIIRQLEAHFPSDVALMEQYMLPLFTNELEAAQLREAIRVVRIVDEMPRAPRSRTLETQRHVRFHVGQVFQHLRYRYVAVIIGWDVECKAEEQWQERMNVAQLPRGKHQSFYNVLYVRFIPFIPVSAAVRESQTDLTAEWRTSHCDMWRKRTSSSNGRRCRIG